ncbi:hypothetical protein APSETT444_006702 [Aspergillus pseudonomiae]
MAPANLSHRQTHNLLLISKLLSLRDTASPLTLLLDSLEQPATPLVKEYIRRAKISKVHVTLIAFETLKPLDGVDAFVSARRKSPAQIVKEVGAAYQATSTKTPSPLFGLEEEQDGVLLGRLDKPIGKDSAEGIVLEMEHRRKSGRGVLEWYILPPASRYSPQQLKEVVTLLDDHPLYRPPEEPVAGADEEEPESTFELRLTDRQRREREGVVLPYFDAQQGDGPGEGGRILYDMGEEDDFDEEEDEI